MCGRQPLGDHPSEDVRTGEKRLRLHRRGQRLECGLMLAATGVQHTRHHVQQHGGGRVNIWPDDFPTAVQPTLCLLELARPHLYGCNRP
ncbi:MAG: hypothetical protein E6I89_06610 [Chloroflexi bacterium]|nr:MAG: hypothetical protein E6I89_06610 [Chloroflexota bacterium]